MTGVPARLIEKTACLYGREPSLLWMGQALQRQPTGAGEIERDRDVVGRARLVRHHLVDRPDALVAE